MPDPAPDSSPHDDAVPAVPPALPVCVWRIATADPIGFDGAVAALSAMLRAGDFVALSGELGAGKTTFARAVIRRLAADPELDVPSPTFTLLQGYDLASFPIVHADLYRISGEDELAELGWEDAANGALVLVEWPDRIAARLPDERLDIDFAFERQGGARLLTITGRGSLAPRLEQARAIDALLTRAGFKGADRVHMTGDASTRAYERVTMRDGRRAVLMMSPPRVDAHPARAGKPYHHVARLAGDIYPFLTMATALGARGLSTPRILADDASRGLAVLEDLGSEPVVNGGAPSPERFAEAVALLAWLHDQPLPDTVAGVDGRPYQIPRYDLDALLVEAELLLDWYMPQMARSSVPASARANFYSLFGRLSADVLAGPTTWCLRDFHSPNLIWQPDRQGLARVGIIDFQDCVIGHPAYDLASLLQDARVTVSDDLELRLLGVYAQHRRSNNALFDMPSFAEAYAILGVQRATKILGAFARLNKRDRKPQYLAHLPRVERYLAKGLEHPAMSGLRSWFQIYLPKILEATGPRRQDP